MYANAYTNNIKNIVCVTREYSKRAYANARVFANEGYNWFFALNLLSIKSNEWTLLIECCSHWMGNHFEIHQLKILIHCRPLKCVKTTKTLMWVSRKQNQPQRAGEMNEFKPLKSNENYSERFLLTDFHCQSIWGFHSKLGAIHS